MGKMENPRFTPKEREILAEIEQMISDIKCGVNVNDNIKLLSIRHNVTKSYLQELRKPFIHPLDLKYSFLIFDLAYQHLSTFYIFNHNMHP